MNIKEWFKSKKVAQFFAEEAETQVSFDKAKGLMVGGEIFNYHFELKDEDSSAPQARAVAIANGIIRAVTLWQDTKFPELSAYYALRHALEKFNPNSSEPRIGDVARFVLDGKDKTAIIAGSSRHAENGILIAETDVPPFLDGGKIMFQQATLRTFAAERFQKSVFHDEIKVWKPAEELTDKPYVSFKLLKPTWFIF